MEEKIKKKKVKVAFTMDEELYKKFELFIENNLLSQSAVLEKLVEEYMKKQSDKNYGTK